MDNIKLNRKEFRDRVYACWLGKNIGGTIGTPYEHTHDILDIKGFTTEPGAPLPNDDLDLQMLWLYGVEQMGIHAINSLTLGELWLSLCCVNWNEYGIGKINMNRGLIPPMSGDYQNDWQNSNGAWIRTEIWACLAPACPNVAAKYALEDAKVDHGSGEGTFSAAFVAAMQSAAFAVSDLRKCIEIGLKQIPEDCRTAKSIRMAIDCYDRKVPPTKARNMIQQSNADIGNGWFEAPSNVAYAILGLLYGEGDFKKSVLTAVNCGDDTDCTAATVGATLGILGTTAAIPDDWKRHIGDDIITISIAKGDVGRTVPETCTELTDRVVRQTPSVLLAFGNGVKLHEGETYIPEGIGEKLLGECNLRETVAAIKPYSMHLDFTFLNAEVVLDGVPEIAPFGEKRIHINFRNNSNRFDRMAYNLNLRWWLPDGFKVQGRKTLVLNSVDKHQTGLSEIDFVICAGEEVSAVNRCVLEVEAAGRISPIYIPINLLG